MSQTPRQSFSKTPTELLNNPAISLGAKGLYAYIQSKPKNWKFSIEKISYQVLEKKGVVAKFLKELEAYGYLTRTKVSSGRGKWDIVYNLSSVGCTLNDDSNDDDTLIESTYNELSLNENTYNESTINDVSLSDNLGNISKMVLSKKDYSKKELSKKDEDEDAHARATPSTKDSFSKKFDVKKEIGKNRTAAREFSKTKLRRPVEELAEQYMQHEEIVETSCMRMGLDPPTLERWVRAFVYRKKQTGELEDSWQNFCRHFSNWLAKQNLDQDPLNKNYGTSSSNNEKSGGKAVSNWDLLQRELESLHR